VTGGVSKVRGCRSGLGNFVGGWGWLGKFCRGVFCYGIFNLGCRVSNALCMEPRSPLLPNGVVGVYL